MGCRMIYGMKWLTFNEITKTKSIINVTHLPDIMTFLIYQNIFV